jgi:hypothetical protein
MALFQIVAVLVFNGPNAASIIYSVATANVPKDTYRRAVEQPITSLVATYSYGPFAVTYLFLTFTTTIYSSLCF